jgi:hypothetical protein
VTPEARWLIVTFGLGATLAFLGSVPMTGPLALLVLDRIIALQRRAAFWIALAGAVVEGVIAAIVATLLPLVLRHSEAIVFRARLSGAIVIFAIGMTLALRPELLESIKTDRKRQSFAAGFLTTALNPTLLADRDRHGAALERPARRGPLDGHGLRRRSGFRSHGVVCALARARAPIPSLETEWPPSRLWAGRRDLSGRAGRRIVLASRRVTPLPGGRHLWGLRP